MGEEQGALAVNDGSKFPYVLLVNVAIAELQGLRDKAEEATRSLLAHHLNIGWWSETKLFPFVLRTRRRRFCLKIIVSATKSLTAASNGPGPTKARPRRDVSPRYEPTREAAMAAFAKNWRRQ